MKCNDIREKLSAYAEEILSAEEKMLIDEHIRSCQECNGYLAEMRKTIRHVRNLEGIEPPAWLATKIMARIKTEALPKKGIFQRLFYPLYIKLPIQAVATILIAFSALYIYKTIQHETKFVEVTSDDRVSNIPFRESPVTNDTRKSEPSSFRAEKQILPAERLEDRKDKTAEVPEEAKPIQQQALSDEQEIAQTLQQKRELAPSPASLEKNGGKAETAYRSIKTQVLAEKKEERILFTVSVKDPEAAENRLREYLIQNKEKIIKTEIFEGKRRIITELKSESMHDLMTTLQLEGEITEKKADSEILQGMRIVEIEFVKQ